MKKILTIVLLMVMSLPMMAGLHTYAESSVLANGSWVKIRVSQSGVCKMTFGELQSAGISNPANVRVFGYGGAQKNQDFSKSNIDDLPQVPVYVGTDYVLFYVQGPISWTYNTGSSRFTHTRNTYSNYGYYFLTENVGSPLAPTESAEISGTPTEVTTYPLYQVHDFDSINLIDRSGISGGGQTFYGEQFAVAQRRTFTFSTPNAITDENSKVYIDLAAYASAASTFTATLNGSKTSSVIIGAPKISDYYTMGVAGAINMNGVSAASQQQVQLQLQNNTASGALGWLNYIEITTQSELKMTGSYMPVRTLVNRNNATPVRFHLTNASTAMQVWDITRLDSITRMPTTFANGELTWVGTQADGVHEYVAVNPQGSSWVSAEVIGNVANQNLHALNNIDYVIICPEGYEAVSRQLAQAHQAKEGITWAVVTNQQVYNEFSSGTPDATAYRWLMKMLYDRANNGTGQAPRWLLLMGHGTFDNRKLLRTSGTSLMLSYQAANSLSEVKAYASDDYFGWLDDNEGLDKDASKAKMDIGVGRLPFESLEEAQTTVNKLIAYIRNEQSGKWKNQLVYLADDGENGMHTRTAEESAERVRVQNPDFVVHKIFLDAYPQEVNASGESYPLAKNRLQNLLKSGVLFFDYSGHGAFNSITNEAMLNLKDIESMTNKNQAFWLFVTCNFAQCDAGKRSAAEAAVLNPRGGAISILSATRTAYAQENTNLNRSVCQALFDHTNTFHYEATLGEAIATGKNQLNNDDNKLTYVLLGDPALRLNFPTDYWVQTNTQIDTLNALSVQHVAGQIIDEDSALVSDFNGTVDITIYDKMQSIPTRDNDQVGGDPEVVAYNDYPGTIFSGSTQVKNGAFEYTFMVPKDIRYNYGNGRIVYYAHDTAYNEDAVGHFEQFVLGGTGSIVTTDTVGPTMHIYLNSPAFRNGDKTYATPRFFAELEDEHGINTAGAGIGHDLMLIIDDDAKKIYTLNDYFISENDSYQRGKVSYLMNELPDGPHSLTFRAWDLLNNSTTQSLNFVVEAGLDPSISSVITYPNPVQQGGTIHMLVNYDQPDELLSTELYLYSLSGQKIYSRTQENPDIVTINLSELGLQPGVYMYTIRIKSESSKYSSNSGKIIVTR